MFGVVAVGVVVAASADAVYRADWFHAAFVLATVVLAAGTLRIQQARPPNKKERRPKQKRSNGKPSPPSVNTNFPGLRTIRETPVIYSVDGFLSDALCRALIAAAEPHLDASPIAFGGAHREADRTSSSCLLQRTRPECVELRRRVGALTGAPLAHMEDPQVARYRRGEAYAAHFDAPSWSDDDGPMFHACGGARTHTVLIYLNDVSRGGATRFCSLEPTLEVRPSPGMALLFHPMDGRGRVDQALLHEAATAVDEKWVCQVWVRQRSDPSRTFMENAHSV